MDDDFSKNEEGENSIDFFEQIEREIACRKALANVGKSEEQIAEEESAAEAQRKEEAQQEREQAALAVQDWIDDIEQGGIVDWNTHHFSLGAPYSCGWVDVYCHSLAQAAGWNWCWTVDPLDIESLKGISQAQDNQTDDDTYTDEFSFNWPYDATLEILPAPVVEGQEFPNAPLAVRLRLDSGGTMNLDYLLDDEEWTDYRKRSGQTLEDTEWRWQRNIAWASFHTVEDYVHTDKKGKVTVYPAKALTIDGQTWYGSRVWTPDAISAGLTHWVASYSGRTDIAFNWNPNGKVSPMIDEIMGRLQEYFDDKNGKVTVAPGIKVASSVFDWLLTLDAQQSAAFVADLRKTKQEQEDDESKRFDDWFNALTEQGRQAYLDGDLEAPDDL